MRDFLVPRYKSELINALSLACGYSKKRLGKMSKKQLYALYFKTKRG